VLFDGKLISEGFSVWCASKILTRYGRHKQIEQNFCEHFGHNEYGVGFEFLKWVEDTFGNKKVIELIKQGYITDKNGKNFDLEHLQQESKIQILVTPRLGEKIPEKESNI
jgi:hypothetical protein